MPAVISSISVSTIANSTATAPRGGEGSRSRCEAMASTVQLDFGGRNRLDQSAELDHQTPVRGTAGEDRRCLHKKLSHADNGHDAAGCRSDRCVSAVHDHEIQ